MFQKNDFDYGQGGATASISLADAIAIPLRAGDLRHWRERLREYCDEINLVPDLGQRIGSAEWLRGVLTCGALCASALYLYPGFAPIPGLSEQALTDRQFDEARAQMITPLALGADTGRHMAASDIVAPLKETPERPQIDLTAAIGSGDSFSRTLRRAGVSDTDASKVMDLLSGAIATSALTPGTRIDIRLGRRASRNVPRPLDALTFRARLDLALSMKRVDGALTLTKIPIAVDATPLRIRGTVGSSLYRSARAAGAPAKAIQTYLKAIVGKISLDRDVGANDRFDIILDYRRAETGEVEVGGLLYAGLERTRGKDLNLLKWTTGGRTEWFEASGVGEQRGQLAAPVNARVTSGYGMRRHPILGYSRMHAGIDFGARYGTPIHAVTDGRVVYSGRHGGHGKYVKIDHGRGLATGYGHMSRIAANSGEFVRRGQVIGYVGSTGLSTGPHLHYELYRNGRTVNPNSVKFTTTAQLAGNDLRKFRARLSELRSLKAGLPEPVQSAQKTADAPKEIALLPNGTTRLLR
ncbi:peptidoglycan DD-metalloendopeptidase family protein [Rhizorhapis sp. SPR117]|uniref:peptidoglycan DD-metalloendopeptidase family protein n=1 Tax=Rhizorhapis sp. SPR117 TaxID=2912611 RepID=UPI001F3E9EEE|nr:M23 family metallopeptidase [Rhizorhapis sp. SPR117]